MDDDAADRHIAAWRQREVTVPFDATVEGIVVRVERLARYFRTAKQTAATAADLPDFAYDTLHVLVAQDPSGSASPTELARTLGVTTAGMTTRLDRLERAGYVRRAPVAGDRRRLTITITDAGIAQWKAVMAQRGRAEEDLVLSLSPTDRATLNALLKKLTQHLERTT